MFSKKLHHAYLIEGDTDNTIGSVLSFLEDELKFKTKANPDFFKNEYDVFGIDEARRTKDIQSKKAFGGKKIFLIAFNSITREAQNSLLKLFEEPTKGTHFFVITRTSDILLPTLKSRMEIVSFNLEPVCQQAREDLSVEEFLKASKANRLNLLKNIIKEKNKHDAVLFLDDLERKLEKNTKSKEIILALREIRKGKKYLNTRSSSVKIILEHIALII